MLPADEPAPAKVIVVNQKRAPQAEQAAITDAAGWVNVQAKQTGTLEDAEALATYATEDKRSRVVGVGTGERAIGMACDEVVVGDVGGVAAGVGLQGQAVDEANAVNRHGFR